LQLKFLGHLVQLREQNLKKMQDGDLRLGNVTTVNINMVKLGMFGEDGKSWQTNIIPPEAKAAIDIRIDPSVDLPTFQRQLLEWAADSGVKVSYLSGAPLSNPMTSIAQESHYWAAFSHVLTDLKIKFETAIFPAATDSRFFRFKGVPAIGFSPMANTPVLLHDHDEFLNEQVRSEG
jgi:aminoacylase